MAHQPSRLKIVILSGSGLSAESGLPVFRGTDGLWNQYHWQELASPEGWRQHPEAVLAFYNERRKKAWDAQPNAAHLAIAELEKAFEVVVVTQNVDALHERAGSSQVLYLHGELAYVRGTTAHPRRYCVEGAPIALGDVCEDGSQLRPDIVWFGEAVQHIEEAWQQVTSADKILVVGTSLSVFPAASLVTAAGSSAEKVLVSLAMDQLPPGFRFLAGRATEQVPKITAEWLGRH